MSKSDVCRRQILVFKVDPRTVRVQIFLIVVDIYDDFILKKPLVSMVYTKLSRALRVDP